MRLQAIEAVAVSALSILLQHPIAAADQQVICKMLQVCKKWRAAVQQSNAGLTNVKYLVPKRHERYPSCCCSVTDLWWWLRHHKGVVRSISIRQPCVLLEKQEQDELDIGSRLQYLFSSRGVNSTVAAVKQPTGTTYAQQQHKWRLYSFHSNMEVSAATLSGLQAADLTELLLDRIADPIPLAGPLAQLTTLQRLRLITPPIHHKGLPSSVLETLAKLPQLNSLEVGLIDDTNNSSLLPRQLQDLTVGVSFGMVNLGHLHGLTSLDLGLPDSVEAGSVLPAQLQHLSLRHSSGSHRVNIIGIEHLGISSLHHLRFVELAYAVTDAGQLSMLTSLPCMAELRLSKQEWETARVTTPAHSSLWSQRWSTLTMLRSLQLSATISERDPEFAHRGYGPDVVAELDKPAELVLGTVARLTSLTCLHLTVGWNLGRVCRRWHKDPNVPTVPPTRLCEHLKGLSLLQDLDLVLQTCCDARMLAPDDALQLTALTDLTRLCLPDVVDDATYKALVDGLPRLQCLKLCPVPVVHRLCTTQ